MENKKQICEKCKNDRMNCEGQIRETKEMMILIFLIGIERSMYQLFRETKEKRDSFFITRILGIVIDLFRKNKIKYLLPVAIGI